MLSDQAEGRELRTADGRRMILGALIKSGGAGSVYRVHEQPEVVAKLYHDSVDHPLYERKVEAMLQLTPQLPDINEGGKRYVQIAWPRALLRDMRGRFVGYLMPAVDVKSTSELECVLQEKQARSMGLPTGLGAKVTLAANLAGVLAELHRQQHRIVDLKPVNLRFYPGSLYMAVLDCDGFSIQGRGERFEAPQYTVDYLAPEFQRGGLSAIGEEAQDRFALAVIVFQLLNFGIHPFTGRPTSEAVPTDIPGRIAARLYAYGLRGNTRLLPSPASGHESMPSDLRALLDRAFEGAGTSRPSALEWGAALRGYAQRSSLRLTHCTREREHQHFAGLPCAACARSALLAKTAKSAKPPPPARIPRAVAGAPRAQRAPGRGGFHWRRPGAPLPPSPPPPPPPPFRPRGAPIWPVGPAPPPLVFKPRPYRRPGQAPGGCLGFVVAFVAFLAVFLVSLGVYYTIHYRSPRRDPQPDIRPLNPVAQVVPVDPIQPIATRNEGDARRLPSWSEIENTRTQALWVALGTADDNPVMVNNAMRELRSTLRNQPPAKSNQHRDMQARFRGYAALLPTMDAGQRAQTLQMLAANVEAEPYNAEIACEWAWLALLDGRQAYAYDGFLRVIWADPQYTCGWLGLGALTEDARSSYGALVVAENLRVEVGDGEERDALVEAALGADPLRVERWKVLQARARVRTARQRGAPLPGNVVEFARRPLPERAR